jgi:septal ring factor EnvC (AmiA/AmiB activator)
MKLDKIEKEMQRVREKITHYQNQLKELDAQKTEAENLQIVQMVRSMRLSPQELKAFLSGDEPQGAAAPAAYSPYIAQEETEDEE